MVRKQIRWNMFTKTGEQERTRHRYTFAVINKPREIERIKEKIIEQMAVVDEFNAICDYPIPRSGGLHCRVFSFSSEKGKIERPNAIYDNLRHFRRDRDLSERTEKGLLPYLERLVA